MDVIIPDRGNTLPQNVASALSLSGFRKRLKTHMALQSYACTVTVISDVIIDFFTFNFLLPTVFIIRMHLHLQC